MARPKTLWDDTEIFSLRLSKDIIEHITHLQTYTHTNKSEIIRKFFDLYFEEYMKYIASNITS